MHKLTWQQMAFRSIITVLVICAAVYPFVTSDDLSEDGGASAPILIPDFAKFKSVQEKKKAFFGYLKPELERQNNLIKEDRLFLINLRSQLQQNNQVDSDDIERLSQISMQYKMDEVPENKQQWQALLSMVDIIPVELTLVQAANESAWGTSRFAKKGYNFFGLWCYRKGCGFVPKRRDDGAAHEVAKFKNLPHAVETYLLNLNSYYAYDDLRMIRADLRSQELKVKAETIAQGLLNYSTRREAYVDELVSMIRHNRKYM